MMNFGQLNISKRERERERERKREGERERGIAGRKINH